MSSHEVTYAVYLEVTAGGEAYCRQAFSDASEPALEELLANLKDEDLTTNDDKVSHSGIECVKIVTVERI